MTKNTSLILLLLTFLFISTTSAQEVCEAPASPTEYQSHENVTYKKNLGMDIFLPKNITRDLPVAMIIHGGSWIKGDRKDFNKLAIQLTSMGYAAVTVSYSFANTARGKFPVPVEDLRCAVKTLKNKSPVYSMNTERITTIGFSAGAHLAAELALTADSTALSDKECPVDTDTPEVHGAVGYYGPYDLRKTEDLNFSQIWILNNFLGASPTSQPEKAALASPAAQINDEALPFYIVHAANDDTVPVRSSQEFHVALQASKNTVKYVETNDGAHGLRLFDNRPFANEATCGSIRYLKDFASIR